MRFSVVATPRLITCLCAAFAVAAALPTQAAATTNTFTVEYRRHATSDPTSAVTARIIVNLERHSTTGSQVGWRATSIEFRQPGTGGAADNVWQAQLPTPQTSDGLWWVTHADANNPTTAEFKVPPRFTGTAAGVELFQSALSFDFRGLTYTPPASPGQPPFQITARLNMDLHTLLVVVIPPETDEPVELPPICHPPGGSA